MFFDVKGIKWVLLVLLGIVAFCVIDLHCSYRRDRAAAAKDESTVSGVISHVREEMAAGRREVAIQRADQINEQLRDLRVIARRMVKAGKSKDVRRVLKAIQELEEMKDRLEKKSKNP